MASVTEKSPKRSANEPTRQERLSRRDLLRGVGGLGLALTATAGTGCLGWPLWGDGTAAWGGPFSFIVMADPQLGMIAQNEGFEAETALFESAIAHVNRLHPRFAVVCGDLINRPGDADQTAELMRIASQLNSDIPIHWVAGNHDVENAPTSESLRWYRETFGPDMRSFDFSGCHFITLNSSLMQQPENVPDEAERQMEWLRSDLERSAQHDHRHIIVFMHHPLCLSHRDEEDGYFVIPQETRFPLLDLFHEHSVTAVFSGHWHRNAIVQDGDLELVTTGPVGKPLGDDPSGFRIVEVHADRLIHAYHGFDSMPQSILSPRWDRMCGLMRGS
jgi:serine/threonine-protein phosphatase CPPED1